MRPNIQNEIKYCSTCARPMEWRKAWEKNWDSIKYCSDACRKNKNKKSYETEILSLLESRYPKTICPSEVLNESDKQNKEIMESVRQSARKLVLAGRITIEQNNKLVKDLNFKGPIRLRLKK